MGLHAGNPENSVNNLTREIFGCWRYPAQFSRSFWLLKLAFRSVSWQQAASALALRTCLKNLGFRLTTPTWLAGMPADAAPCCPWHDFGGEVRKPTVAVNTIID